MYRTYMYNTHIYIQRERLKETFVSKYCLMQLWRLASPKSAGLSVRLENKG